MTNLRFTCILIFFLSPTLLHAGHSRSGYLDAGQSADGRYLVTAKRTDVLDKKEKRTDYQWNFTWLDRRSGQTHQGTLRGLRSGSSDVFDPVNAHIFVAPRGQTFALWVPQAMARASSKKPASEDRSAPTFQAFPGFAYRLAIYKKTGEIVKRFDVQDFLRKDDWQWLYSYGCQVYWLTEYPDLHTRSAPRAGYALYRISPDYTLLEFQIGANSEATYKAKQRGVTPPKPRTVRIRLTDGHVITDKEPVDGKNVPQQPFVGDLVNKERKQHGYVPSLDPVRVPGRFIERDKNQKPVQLGNSSPPAPIKTR